MSNQHRSCCVETIQDMEPNILCACMAYDCQKSKGFRTMGRCCAAPPHFVTKLGLQAYRDIRDCFVHRVALRGMMMELCCNNQTARAAISSHHCLFRDRLPLQCAILMRTSGDRLVGAERKRTLSENHLDTTTATQSNTITQRTRPQTPRTPFWRATLPLPPCCPPRKPPASPISSTWHSSALLYSAHLTH